MAESSNTRLKAGEVAESVRARRIELVDDSGQVRASLTTPADTGYQTGVVSFKLYDRQGRARAAIEVDDMGAAFGLNDATEEDRVASLYVRDASPNEGSRDRGNVCLNVHADGLDGPTVELSVAPGEEPVVGTYHPDAFGLFGKGGGDLEERLQRVAYGVDSLSMAFTVAARCIDKHVIRGHERPTDVDRPEVRA